MPVALAVVVGEHEGMPFPSYRSFARNVGADGMRRFLNIWPPYLFSSIHIDRISADFREFDVTLRLRPWSQNYVGTQFGGSLFAMCDPWWMIGTLRNLGERDYIVWDQAGEIDFVSPGRGHVRTSIRITDELLDEVRAATEGGEKHLVWCSNDILSEDGQVVARYRKRLYVRRKPVKKQAITA